MSILDLFRRKGAYNPQFSGNENRFSRTWSTAPRAETTRLPDTYHKSPRLDPIDMISETIASCPLVLYDMQDLKKNGLEAKPLTDHPALELLDSPSAKFPEMDGHALMKMTASFIELLGECFWIKFRGGRKIDEIIFIPPGWVVNVPTKAAPFFQVIPYGTTAGAGFQVAPEDMIWFKKTDAADPYGRGRGRTEAMGDELDSDEMAAKFQKNYFYNDGTPPLLINIPGADQATVEAFRDKWAGRVSGWLNARKPAITGGDSAVTVTKLSDTQKEMDFTASRLFLRDQFLQHYQIPPELFGILTSSNRSTIDSAYYLFGKNVIQNRIAYMGRVITRQLIQPDYDARLCLRFDFEIPEDEEFKLKVANEGASRGMITRAEWRQKMGYKAGPNDNVYIVPATLLEVPEGTSIQDAKPEPPAPIMPVSDGESGDDEGNIENPVGLEKPKPKSKGVIKILFKDATPEHKKIWQDFDKKATDGEPAFILAIKAYAKKQRARMGGIIPTAKGIEQAIATTFDGADRALATALRAPWLESMADGYEIAKKLVTGKKESFVNFKVVNEAFLKWVASNGLLKAKGINATTEEKLRKKMTEALESGIAAGESMTKLAARLEEVADGVYDEMSASRAALIARTETMTSVNFGQFATYEEEGITKKAWLSTIDDDTRADHIDCDGQEQDIQDTFDVGGMPMQYPGDPEGGAGNVCNCRCTILPVIKGGE